MKLKLPLSLIICLTVISCSQWKVTDISSRNYAFIKNGTGPGEIVLKTDDLGLENMSFDIGIYNNRIITVDNTLKRVQVLDSDGKTQVIIGSGSKSKDDIYRFVPFRFSIIGQIYIDNYHNIYVQNRFTRSGSGKWDQNGHKMSFSPSYILVFNSDGELQYTLGRKGTPDIPFYHIEDLSADERGRLFVITRSFDTWDVFRFSGKKRDFYTNLGELSFEERVDSNLYKGRIENVKTFNDGERILISVSYYHGLRLKYRKIFEYSLPAKKIVRMVQQIPDPKNVLFNIVDDKYIYFWNLYNGEVKFMVCNMKGDIINNILMEFNQGNNFYTRVMGDPSGKLYSYSVTRSGVEIMEWE